MAPLSDLRVVDLTVARAGPNCVRQLSDWGADVVRLEPPGVESHNQGLQRRSDSDYQNLHRNKRVMTLDLKSEAGQREFFDIVRDADVVVENMRPAVKYRLNVDYETVRSVNPRIVYGSISGFGQDGPDAERGGFDQIAQGMSGIMSVTGHGAYGPTRAGIPLTDLAAGLYLAIGILTALHERERTGVGTWVCTSLLESGIAMLDFQATRWTMDREVPTPAGNHHPTVCPMGCFATSDGHINLGVSGSRQWRSFCAVLGLDDVVDDARFATGDKRSRHREELIALIESLLAERSSEEWLARLSEAGIPAGPVYRIDEVFRDRQVVHLAMDRSLADDSASPISVIRSPLTIGGQHGEIWRRAPDFGEDSDEIRLGHVWSRAGSQSGVTHSAPYLEETEQ